MLRRRTLIRPFFHITYSFKDCETLGAVQKWRHPSFGRSPSSRLGLTCLYCLFVLTKLAFRVLKNADMQLQSQDIDFEHQRLFKLVVHKAHLFTCHCNLFLETMVTSPAQLSAKLLFKDSPNKPPKPQFSIAHHFDRAKLVFCICWKRWKYDFAGDNCQFTYCPAFPTC